MIDVTLIDGTDISHRQETGAKTKQKSENKGSEECQNIALRDPPPTGLCHESPSESGS